MTSCIPCVVLKLTLRSINTLRSRLQQHTPITSRVLRGRFIH